MHNNSRHVYVEVIEKYYMGCNTADVDLMISTFAPDVVHYFVDHPPVRGAHQLANYWSKVGPKTQANWKMDHIVIQEPEAVIEWSMRWVPMQTGESEILRGSEWYLFDGEHISEIRSYHNNFFLHDKRNRELRDFDYARRGYRIDRMDTDN